MSRLPVPPYPYSPASPYAAAPDYYAGPRSWLRRRPPHVGLDSNDPGAQWGQAPTAKETAQGYKNTDVLTLSMKVGALRAKIEDVLSQVDPSTDASALAALKSVHDQVVALDTAVASRIASGHDTPSNAYPILLIKYNALAAQFAGFGIEEATAPAEKPSAANPAPAPPPTKTIQAPASPTAPTVVKKPSGGIPTAYLGYALAATLVFVGALFLKAGKLF